MPTAKERSASSVELRKERGAKGHFMISYLSDAPPSWKVESSSGQTYHVLLPSFPSREGAQCSCPDFLRRGLGTCKHMEAVLAYAAINPPPAPKASSSSETVSWAELEGEYGDAVRELLKRDLPPEELAKEMRRLGKAYLK
jgi:hypothetical protein